MSLISLQYSCAAAGELPEDVCIPQAMQQHAGQQVARAHEHRPKDDAQQHQRQKALHAEVRACTKHRIVAL